MSVLRESIPDLQEDFIRFPELRVDDLQHLRDWNAKEAHLPTVPDDQLVKFFVKSRFSLEKTKRTINTCFTVRTHVPEIFDRLDPLLPQNQPVWEYVHGGLLPKCDSQGTRLLMMNFTTSDASQFVHVDVAAWFEMMLSVLSLEPTAPGIRILFDCNNFSLGHIARVNLVLVRKYLVYVQDGLMFRLVSFHLLNYGAVMEKMLSLIKPFMKPKLLKKFKFHNTFADLYESIPMEVLPSDYGGQADSMKDLTGDLRNKFVSMRGWFQENERLRVDESRRLGPPIDTNELFGMEGSFRDLKVD